MSGSSNPDDAILLTEKISVPQAAKMLGVGDDVVRRWKAEGHLRGYDYPPSRDEKGNIIRRGIMRIDLSSVRELLAKASRTSAQLRSESARVPGAWSRRGASCN